MVDTIQGDPAKLVAATLVQAEATLRGARLVGKGSTMGQPSREVVSEAYAYYLELVTTGQAPPKR